MISRIFSILLSGAVWLVLLVGQAFALSSSYVTDDGGVVSIRDHGADQGGILKIGQERPQAMLEYERFDDNGSVKLSIDASGQDSGYVLNWQLIASDGAESNGSLAMAITSPQSCAEAKNELPEVVSEALQSIWLAVEKDAMSTAVEGVAGIDSVGDGAMLKSSCSALTHAAGLAACGVVVACGATGCGGGAGCAGCVIAAVGCLAYVRDCLGEQQQY